MTRRIRASGLALILALIVGAAIVAPSPTDANPSGKGRPALSIGDATAYEGDGVLSFPITLDGPASRALRVNAVPLPGTARPAKDYRPGAISTVIPRGATGGTLKVISGKEYPCAEVEFTVHLTERG